MLVEFEDDIAWKPTKKKTFKGAMPVALVLMYFELLQDFELLQNLSNGDILSQFV